MVTPIRENVPSEMTDKIVVFSACGSLQEAERLAGMLVEEKLAACASIIAPVRSFYRWKGAVENAAEWLLMIKTSRDLFDRVQKLIAGAHSYEVPELIALPVTGGSAAYLAWMDGELRGSR
jgi:periplasmic divalent cation tolerance protein